MTKNKNVSNQDIVQMVTETGDKMKRLLQISSAEGSSLKNQHNQLFLSLMENLNYQKEQEKKREERQIQMQLSRRTDNDDEADES